MEHFLTRILFRVVAEIQILLRNKKLLCPEEVIRNGETSVQNSGVVLVCPTKKKK